MKLNRFVSCAILLSFSVIAFSNPPKKVNRLQPANLTSFVDPAIGTGGHGHVFLGANVPFGLVQLGPTEPVRGWDWCSGYNDCDSVLTGFGHMHLSGTGIGDLGDVLVFPTVDKTKYTTFSHQRETCRPGYYSLVLNGSNIKAELTATARVGFHRYTYPQGKNAFLIFNVLKGIGWDNYMEGSIRQENDSVISGYRISKGWAKHQVIFFTAQFSSPIQHTEVQGDTVKTFSFALSGRPLLVKVALSPVSIENAKMNMKAELPGWNFDATVAAADKAWNVALGKIRFNTKNTDEKKVFYTAFYHTMIAPSLFCDVNGDYYGSDGKIHRNSGFRNYTTFSLWDTYRGAHPLMTLVHRDMLPDMAQTFIHIFQEQGKLPIWHLMGNETDCMVGCPGVPVLADMLLKGTKMNKAAAFNAIKKSLLRDERGLKEMREYGYIPYDKAQDTIETVSRALEYALADGSAALVAKNMNLKSDYQYFFQRSKNYSKYFDVKTRFMRAVYTDGSFRVPFDPCAVPPQCRDYTEGNAWQYTWLVPHDVHGLIRLFGGEKPFVTKLDSLFIVKGDLGKDAVPDVSGLVGQYAHGNEPSHHILYMYAYAGMPWKSAPILREVMRTQYTTAKDGLSGNEDVGQMSAWYVLSAMGIYQVEPAGGKYVFGSPLMDEAVLNVGGNKAFRIVARNNSVSNIYIQRVTLNGKPYTKSYIDYPDIMKGGTLEFVMGNKPSTFGTSLKDRP